MADVGWALLTILTCGLLVAIPIFIGVRLADHAWKKW